MVTKSGTAIWELLGLGAIKEDVVQKSLAGIVWVDMIMDELVPRLTEEDTRKLALMKQQGVAQEEILEFVKARIPEFELVLKSKAEELRKELLMGRLAELAEEHHEDEAKMKLLNGGREALLKGDIAEVARVMQLVTTSSISTNKYKFPINTNDQWGARHNTAPGFAGEKQEE